MLVSCLYLGDLGDSGLAGDLAPLGVHLDTCAYTRLRFGVDTQRQRGGRKGQDQHSNVDGLSVNVNTIQQGEVVKGRETEHDLGS